MRRILLLGVLALATLATGCGGGKSESVTVVQTLPTQPAPSPPGTATTPPGTTTTPPGTTTTAAPLPGGRAAVDGRYLMRIRDTSYEGQNIVASMIKGDESTWPITTVCEGGTCRLEVRRELESGAFENFTLREIKDRSYAAASTGKTKCAVGATDKVNARQRLSLRVGAIGEANGRPTAQRVDAYMTIRARCGNDPVRGIISWRGTRLP